MRVKGAGSQRRARRKRILKFAEGFRGRRKNCLRRAMEAVDHSLKYATRDRKQRKRQFRRLWILRINAAARRNGTTYSRLMHHMKTAGIGLDRKVLAQIAYHDPESFAAVVQAAGAA